MREPRFNQNQNTWEIDVPKDNSCLFWAVSLAYLIPVKDNHDDSQQRFERPFGKRSMDKLKHVKNWIKAYNPFSAGATTNQDETFQGLVRKQFRRRVIKYIEDNESQFKSHIEGNFMDYLNCMRNSNSWGGEPEIRAMSDLLDCRIQVISAGQEHSYGDGTLIQLFHVGALADSPEANHYRFGLDKSLGDAYQLAIKLVVSQRQEEAHTGSSSQSVSTIYPSFGEAALNQSSVEKLPQAPEKITSKTTKVTAVSGTGHTVHANNIEVTGMKVTQKILPQRIKDFSQALKKITIQTTNVSSVSGTGNTVYAEKIKSIGQQVILPAPPAEHLPKTWQIPPQNPNFTGRKELLKQIENHFSKGNAPVVLTTTHGLGGIGKTQLATEFIWQHFQEYKGVVWFNAENRSRLLNDYIRLGIELNILHQDDKDGIEECALLVKHWLEDPDRAGWLLIYDNAPKYGGRGNEGVGDLFPAKEGKIIVTSRYAAGWPNESIQVDVFTLEESRIYIQRVLVNKALDIALVDQLAEQLGRLPLALAQACAYIKYTPISILDYLRLYEERKRELLSDETLSDQTLPQDAHRAIVYITWDITMDTVRKESLLADKWLTICAYLNSNDIPNSLLEAFAVSSENNPNSEMFETALGALGSYSMLTIDNERNNASVHNLVQEVIQLQSEEKGKVENNHHTVFQLLRRCFPYLDKTPSGYINRRQLLPHVEAFCSHLDTRRKASADLLGKEIEKKYLENVLSWMADGYRGLGDWRKTRDLLERALTIQERHYGHDHLATLNTRNSIALILDNQGKYEEALHAYREIYEKSKSPQFTLSAQHNMAIVLFHQGKYVEALGAYQEIYEKRMELLGPEHYETLSTRNNMAVAFNKQGRLEEALQAYREVYDIWKHKLGTAHSDTLTVRNNMAFILDDQGKYEEALVAYQEVYETSKQLLGSKHPDTSTTQNNIGGILLRQGKHEEALQVFREILEIEKDLLGPKHPDTLTTLNNIAYVLNDQGKHKEALEAYQEVYEKIKESLGSKHPNTLTTRRNMAGVLRNQDRYEETLQAYQEVYDTWKHELGSAHPDTLAIRHSIAEVLSDQGEYEKALKVYQEVYEKRKDLLGPTHPYNLGTQNNMAGILYRQGKYGEALIAFQEIYEIGKPVLESNHPIIKNALHVLGQIRAKTEYQSGHGVNDQLFTAAKNGDVQWVRDCIGRRANVNARDNNNWTPLHHAAENGHIAVVDILVQNRASINAENNGKATPLHFAARNGHIAVVEALLSSRAMLLLNVTTQSNWTPLHFAAKQGHISIVKALLKHGADINAKNKVSKTALSLAAESGHLALAVVLLNHDHINATGVNEQQREELTNYIIEHHPDDTELLITKLFSLYKAPRESP